MFRRLILLPVLVIPTLGRGEDALHVYYYNGETIEQMSIQGVTATVTLKDTGKLNQLAVYVDNASSDAVNVLPSSFALHENSPKEEDLALKTQEEVQKLAGKHALWGPVVSGVTRAKDKVTGKGPTTGNVPPTYEAQAQWLSHAAELGQNGKTGSLGRAYLKASTVFPGTQFAGVLWFDRDDAIQAGVVRVTLGARTYLFPFPPPEYATTPANPEQSAIKKDEIAAEKSVPTQQSRDSANGKGGVLGVSGENWAESNIKGVRITEVTPNSSAELAGLHTGCVITEVDAVRVHSTDELASALAQHGPGTRVSITYFINTQLGWMPKTTAVILSRAD